MDPQHEVIAALGEPAGALSPLAAELAALMATVKTAVARGARYLRVHTDCPALDYLWQDRCDDDAFSPACDRQPEPCGSSSCGAFPADSISRPASLLVTLPACLKAEPAVRGTRPSLIPNPEMFDRDKPAAALAQ